MAKTVTLRRAVFDVDAEVDYHVYVVAAAVAVVFAGSD